MATTLLATKANQEKPFATDDDTHTQLASDPSVTQFPMGSSHTDPAPAIAISSSNDTGNASLGGNTMTTTSSFGGSFNGTNISTSGNSTFGSSASTGFGSAGSFGSSTQSTASFGSSTTSGTTTNSFGGNSFGSSSSTTPTGPQSVLTGAGYNAAEGADVLVQNDNTDWINKKWRPMMGWMYMLVCLCDFTIFPILWSLMQALDHGSVTTQWQPVTLQGAGLFHIAMGAVIGVTAYGRTKEKVAGAA